MTAPHAKPTMPGMSAINFDTYKFVERLEKSGMPSEQAAALAEVQRDSLAEALDTTLATKGDLSRLEKAVRDDLAKVDKELAVLKWMMGVMIGIGLTVLFKLFS